MAHLIAHTNIKYDKMSAHKSIVRDKHMKYMEEVENQSSFGLPKFFENL